MVINKIPENGTPEPLDLNVGGDVLGPKKIERENIIKKKLEIREKYASMRDQIKEEMGNQKDSLDTLFVSEKKNKNISPESNNGKRVEFSSLTPILTRRDADIGKSPILAISDSLVVFGGAARDLAVDFAKLLISPRKQIENTLNPLDDTFPI